MDTTWHDSLHYLLATWIRTEYLVNTDDLNNLALRYAFSLDMWYVATFGVAMHFLHKFPRECLKTLR